MLTKMADEIIIKPMCPFCNLTSEKDRIIKTTEHSIALLSNPRLMEGHTLVIPKRHIEKLADLTAGEREDLVSLVVKMEEKILKTIAPGCDIRQNYRPFQAASNLKVHHLHIHLQPRTLNDDLYQRCQKFETEIFAPLSSGEAEEVLKSLQ